MPRTFSFLHTGDLHLDTPFAGLTSAAPPAISERLRIATLRAWDRIVSLAIERRVDFVVVAGDIFEAETRTLRGQLAFADGLARLAAEGIPTTVVTGNHDPLSGWEATVEWPALAHRFGGDAVGEHSIKRDGHELARVYGISYGRKVESRDLAAGFCRAPDAPFAVGLLHATIGLTDRHERYAPTTEEVLVASGMDYWALGHIHARRVVRAARPCVVYPGNPQGRDPGERDPRGVAIVEVDADGVPHPAFVDTDVVRWVVATLDCSTLATMSDLLAAIRKELAARVKAADGRSIVVRIDLRGFTPLHDELRMPGVVPDLVAAIRADHSIEADPFAWLEAIRDETRSDQETAYARGADFIAELDALVEATADTAAAGMSADDASGASTAGDAASGARTTGDGAARDTLDLVALSRELYADGRVRRALGDGTDAAAQLDPSASLCPLDLVEALQEARTLVLDRLRSTGA